MKSNKALLAGLISMALLAGCTSNNTIPQDPEAEFKKALDKQELINEWANLEPAISIVDDGSPLLFDAPMSIPKDVYDLDFQSSLNTEVKIADLAGMLKPFNIFLSIPEQEIRDKNLVMFDFKGKLGDFLNTIGAAYKISFNWNPGRVLTIENTSDYLVKIPQNKEIADSLSSSISALGAENLNVSLEAGIISYTADYRTQKRVSNFMKHAVDNSALVSMQVAIITVALDKQSKQGIDWSQFNLHLGEASISERLGGLSDSSSTDSSETSDSDSESSDDSDYSTSDDSTSLQDLMMTGSGLADIKAMANLSGQGTNLLLANNNIGLSAVIDYLSTYGDTETTQSVLVKTISGKDVKITSDSEIPYVDSVGVSNIGSSSDSDSDGGSNLGLGTAEIETVDVGLDLKLSPFYSASSELVTIDVDLSLSSLLGMVNVSAGNQIGSLTHPNVQKQTFTDLVKVKAGDTVVIGGIIYDQKSDHRNAPKFMEDIGGAHVDEKFSRNQMIIMIRPSVTLFKDINGSDKKIIR